MSIDLSARAVLGFALLAFVGCGPEPPRRPAALEGMKELIEQAVPLAFEVPENPEDEALIEFPEASGLTYHRLRGTLFAVSDDGHVSEYRTDGTWVQGRHILYEDFEGITAHSVTGLLYLAIEGRDNLLEVDPDGLRILREYDLDRTFEGRKLYELGGDGIEGVAFVPDPSHPEGGTFFVANRSRAPKTLEDPPLIIEMDLPLSDPTQDEVEGEIRSAALLQVTELSGLHYEPTNDRLYAISDENQLLLQLTRAGKIEQIFDLPIEDSEGVAMDEEGNLYVATDSGLIIKMRAKAVSAGR